MPRPLHRRFTRLAALGAAAAALATTAPPAMTQTAPAAARTVVTRADQLPRRSYALPQLPSALLESPPAALLDLAATLERDIQADLGAYDIRDAATQRELLSARLSIALLRGDAAAVSQLGAQVRALQDKPGLRLTSGLLAELALQARAEPAADREARLQAQVTQRYGSMPWADVQDVLKQTKGQLELASATVIAGSVRAALDPAAQNAGMQIDARSLAALIGARAQIEQVLPLRQAVVAGLASVIDRQAAAAPPKPDLWTPRLVTLPADAKLQPVRMAIWDSGVDLALFKALPERGMAFTATGEPSNDLLRPLGEAAPRWPQMRGHTKGALDLRAALDTPEARQLKAAIAALKPEQVKGFQEDLGLVGLYTHGTHVAGIAVEGNPFAQLYAVTMLWDHRIEPVKPTEALSRRTAANYARIVQGLKAAGIRVVNMSWRYGPQFHETALAFHGVGRDGEERKRLAAQLFAIERDALRAAFASAPEILFVAGAGNEDNNADFVEYIPAGFELPNLITAGAVDQAGEETSFSSFGKTVVVHANGFEVDSFIPGGDRLKLSGTSMAAPQVANLAAKLLAIEPKLTAVQLKALMLQHADPRGRVKLLNPKASIEALRARGLAAAQAAVSGS